MNNNAFGLLLKKRVGRFNNPQGLDLIGTYPVATVGAAYSYTPTITGGTGPYTITYLGTIPAGLSFNSTTGAITGTPTVNGRYELLLTLTDANGVAIVRMIWLQVNANSGISLSGSVPTGRQNVAFAGFTPTRTGGTGPFTYAISSGTLPGGLTLNTSTGAVTGTFTGYGTSSCTLQVTDANSNTATLTLNFNITRALALSGSAPSGTQNSAYPGFTPTRVGGAGTITYSISSGTLFTGLSLNTSTGAITGTATVFGTNNVTLTATDSDSYTANLVLSIVIAEAGATPLIETTYDPYYDSGFSLVSNTTVFSRPTQAKPSAKATGHATASYIDQRFGTRIYRASDVADQTGHSPTYFRHEYSRKKVFNADSSRFLVQATNGFWYVVDANTYQVLLYRRSGTRCEPGHLRLSSSPHASRTSPRGGYASQGRCVVVAEQHQPANDGSGLRASSRLGAARYQYDNASDCTYVLRRSDGQCLHTQQLDDRCNKRPLPLRYLRRVSRCHAAGHVPDIQDELPDGYCQYVLPVGY